MGTAIRPTGIDNVASAMRNLERRQEIVANNLANVSTDGFKGERAFARLLSDGVTPAVDTATDFRSGPITQTGAPLDLAITGPGFFVVQSPGGERYSRGGSLRLDDNGQLVDANGHALLGETDGGESTGPIIVPPDAKDIHINVAGAVFSGAQQLGQLRLEGAAANTRLQHDAGGLFLPPMTRTPIASADRTIRQGAKKAT
jgi:flagellar basal-body rod protein FlgF